jgi:small-conductance mechanosensitive channel
MRGLFRLAWLVLLVVAGALPASAPAWAQAVPQPQRPFSQLVDLWTRQLDRITARTDQQGILPAEIDTLREQTADVRAAALAAAQIARNDLADVRRLLAPLDVKPGADQPAETDAVKAERERLTEQATISESRVKQCEVVIARADQLLERMTKLRGEVVLRHLLQRSDPPLSPEVWRKIGPQIAGAWTTITSALAVWGREGLSALSSGDQDLTPLALWAVLTFGLWWLGHALRRRFGRGELTDPGQRDRTFAAVIDGIGVVLVPILAVWLVGKLLAATLPPPPVDALLYEFIKQLITFMLVVGVTTTMLAPYRPAWRVLPFTDDSAQHLTLSMRHLLAAGAILDFLYHALIQGPDRDAVASVGSLVLTTAISLLALPVMSNRGWQAARPAGDATPTMIGGTWWSILRLLISITLLGSIVMALLGYTTLAAHIHAGIALTCMWVAVALVAHQLAGDLLEAIAAPDLPTGRWVRARFGLPSDFQLRGQHIALLLVDLFLVALLLVTIPAAWSVDVDSITRGFDQLLLGVKLGGVTISLGNIGMAIVVFGVAMLLARLIRRVVRDRVMPTVEAPMPLRQSVDAGLNYAGVIIAILVGVGALGIDFTNLAIVLGALSVGIGLGLQNIANNVISGVVLLLERPIKSGDWVSVSGHEGFVRRINIRATEIETFQRTHVIVPNSVFLQNPVVNRTYSDTSSRVEIALTVGFGTDVPKLEGILRESALNHTRVLRVPQPIVRFVRVGTAGLDFELMVFVAALEDRLVVTNDLNKTILGRLIEEKILDPTPAHEFKLRNLDTLADALRGRDSDHAAPPSR